MTTRTYSPTAFADLVRARRAELHLSLAAVSATAIDPETGTQLKHSWIHRLESGEPVIPPQLPQLRAMAHGLQLPLTRLQDAAAEQFLGLTTGQLASGEAQQLAYRFDQLSPVQREALTKFLDAFVPPGI